MSFSERYGYETAREDIQVESMDKPLRNGLWSLLVDHVWSKISFDRANNDYTLHNDQYFRYLCQQLWFSYFKIPLDELGNSWTGILSILKQHFFRCEWNKVYDFVEFVADNFKKPQFHNRFITECNVLLEREKSAYRFVNGTIAPIIEQYEVAEIEQTLEHSESPVRAHLKRALELFSDRGLPDYRNSIKESISAVESLVKFATGENKSTLGQLIKKLEAEFGLNHALAAALNKLYGYTSDVDGVRHGMTELNKTDFNDAKFMLVVCSAFINFVTGKMERKIENQE